MVRSRWKRTLVSTLAWAGLALGQPGYMVNAQSPGASAERVITLQEPGKAAQRCKILKTWQTAEGATAYQVQALDNGEIMTIVESGPATNVASPGDAPTRVQALSTRIFHWGKNGTPPAGTPLPPATVAAPTRVPAPVVTASAPPSVKPVEMPKAPTAPTTPGVWPPPVTPARTPAVGTGYSGQLTAVPVAPTAPTGSVSPVDSKAASTDDWRKSWGTAGDHKSQPVVQATGAPVANTVSAGPGLSPVPSSSMVVTDPLLQPGRYNGRTEEKGSYRMFGANTRDNTAKGNKGVEEGTPAKGMSLWQKTPASAPVTARSTELPPLPVMPPYPTEVMTPGTSISGKPGAPLGAASVLAAGEGNVQFIPVPIATVPEGNPHQPGYRPPQPPQPFGAPRGNGYAMPQNKALMPSPVAGDPAMANAFTAPPPPEGKRPESNAFLPPGLPAQQGVVMMPPPPPGMPMMMPGYPQGMVPGGYVSGPVGVPVVTEVNPAKTGPDVSKHLSSLRDSVYPSQREYAVESMATVDWRANPQVVDAMVTAAKTDPAATVRACCVRTLAKMNVNTAPVITTLQGLKTDNDPRVRQEVDQALVRLSVPATSRDNLLPATGFERAK